MTRSAETEGISDARLLWSFALNQLLTVGQIVGGIYSGSLALLSDAAHNFNDANALLIAYIARRVSRRDANQRYTFGYRRAELIGAVINLTTLAVIGLYLVYEAVMRFFNPEPILGWVMGGVALLALVVDVATALLLWAMAKGSLNVRAAFVHNITDALGSVAVLIGAGLVLWLGWNWVDPLLTLLIAGYVLWQVAAMLPKAVNILMEGTPPDMNLDEVRRAMCAVEGVASMHHLHVWQLDENRNALEAHVVVPDAMPADRREAIRFELKQLLSQRFAVQHSTIEMEAADASHCNDGERQGVGT
ncbi:MAG: cation transporter [Rhodoferax sp.]|nr:cation transporter [Rhodoferax sp.]